VTRLRARLQKKEELRLVVYDDKTGKPIVPGSIVVGHPTIGYGRALDVNGISKAEAEQLLDADLARVEADCAKLPVFAQLDDARKDVLRELVFNIGLDGVRKFKRMLNALALSYFEVAAAEILDSKYRDQVGHRAVELAAAMVSGEW
jgi:lysozyme